METLEPSLSEVFDSAVVVAPPAFSTSLFVACCFAEACLLLAFTLFPGSVFVRLKLDASLCMLLPAAVDGFFSTFFSATILVFRLEASLLRLAVVFSPLLGCFFAELEGLLTEETFRFTLDSFFFSGVLDFLALEGDFL